MAASTHGSSIPVVTRSLRVDAQRNAERLLASARATYAEHGADASLEEIARRAGVGIGTLYRHYPNRQALLVAVFRDDLEAACARADVLLHADDPVAAFTEWLREQLRNVMSCKALGAQVVIDALDDDGVVSPCAALRAGGEQLLTRAQGTGAVRADVSIDDLLRLVSAIALATDDAADGPAQVERLFGLVVDAIRA